MIFDLADELIVHIFRYLRGSTSLHDSLLVLTTCKKFYNTGRPVLFEHLKLDDNSFDSFLWTSKTGTLPLTATRSLTVTLHNEWLHIDTHPTIQEPDTQIICTSSLLVETLFAQSTVFCNSALTKTRWQITGRLSRSLPA